MILYHYTCSCDRHLGSILRDGELRVTESNIGSGRPDVLPYGEHVGPDVVWLTTSEHPRGTQGLEGSTCNKTTVRFTVDVADAQHWPEWSKRHGMHARWRRHFERGMYPHQWYVVERPIPQDEWLAVDRPAEA